MTEQKPAPKPVRPALSEDAMRIRALRRCYERGDESAEMEYDRLYVEDER